MRTRRKHSFQKNTAVVLASLRMANGFFILQEPERHQHPYQNRSCASPLTEGRLNHYLRRQLVPC